MTSSSLRGGSGTNHAFNFDAVKSSSTSTMTSSPTSSPSSTISETSNVSIRTKKPRTTRKRPNQTYNEAATLLSKAYPNLFRNFKNKQPKKFTKQITEKKLSNVSCGVVNPNELERDSGEDFDCESMLDEEIEEGIDSIIGSRVDEAAGAGGGERATPWFGGFGGKLGWARALRRVDGENWWNFVTVDNYDDVRNAWSDRRSPFTGDCSTIRFSSPAGIKISRRKKLKKENV
ncbi:hypothetical protein SESBI_48076 [Sesbania bispinosa]|nr:hypothetical protein SESBI_48076 [Sesbania bispinosa]